MNNKNLQKEILKFIIKKYKEPKHKKGEVVNDISVEFKSGGYSQEIINENLYSLVKNGKISSGREVDNVNHRVYSPLFVLEQGYEQTQLGLRRHLITIVTIVSVVVAAIFSVLSYFK